MNFKVNENTMKEAQRRETYSVVKDCKLKNQREMFEAPNELLLMSLEKKKTRRNTVSSRDNTLCSGFNWL